MKRTRFFLLILAFILISDHPLLAGSIGPHLRQTLQGLQPDDEVAVIITLKDQLNLSSFANRDKKRVRAEIIAALQDKAKRTQQPVMNALRKRNARKVKPFWIFNGMASTVKAAAVQGLAARPDVASIRLDRILALAAPVPSAAGISEWNLEAVNAPALWALGHTGEGVVVANMDTGVDINHPDLGPRWRGGSKSWFDPHGEHPDSPYDSNGHGTGTMGIMVGGDAGGTAIGMAPGARWIAVKMFDDAGNAPYSEIHAGYQWLLDPDGDPGTDDAPDVVNNSWGFNDSVNQCITGFEADIDALKAAGIAVVFAAGNSGQLGPATSISPANYQQSFAVGSVDNTNTIALTSSLGPSTCDNVVFPEIVAPGENIRIADLTSGGTFPNSYAYGFGTSFAAPHVAGAMALLRGALPQLTVAELEDALIGSAADLGPAGPDNAYGYGLLDVAAAYNSFRTFSLAATVTGRGSIVSSPPGIDCPGACTAEYLDGTTVTLTAMPDPGRGFIGWSVDCTGTEAACTVTMDQAHIVGAQFDPFPWHLFYFIPAMGQQH